MSVYQERLWFVKCGDNENFGIVERSATFGGNFCGAVAYHGPPLRHPDRSRLAKRSDGAEGPASVPGRSLDSGFSLTLEAYARDDVRFLARLIL